jgi:hypothetical protein
MARRGRKSSTPAAFRTGSLRRLARIIAERPPQPLTSKLSGDLGKIVAERIAGVAPGQRVEVAQWTILEILLSRPEVPLTGLLRRHVALELARLWIPKREQAKIYRQRRLELVEALIFLAKCGRKTKAWAKAGKPQPQSTALDAVAKASRFQSTAALKQFLKRERQAKKKPRP